MVNALFILAWHLSTKSQNTLILTEWKEKEQQNWLGIKTNQNIFILIRESQFQISGGWQHSLYCPHSIIVVKLWRQLLRTKSIHSYNLHWEVPGVLETKGIQRDLGNHGVVWYHHSHSSEQDLKIVWKLGAPSIPRVHCNTDVTVGVQREFCPFKHEDVYLGSHSSNNAQDLKAKVFNLDWHSILTLKKNPKKSNYRISFNPCISSSHFFPLNFRFIFCFLNW